MSGRLRSSAIGSRKLYLVADGANSLDEASHVGALGVVADLLEQSLDGVGEQRVSEADCKRSKAVCGTLLHTIVCAVQLAKEREFGA